jgi:hypothetical protein
MFEPKGRFAALRREFFEACSYKKEELFTVKSLQLTLDKRGELPTATPPKKEKVFAIIVCRAHDRYPWPAGALYQKTRLLAGFFGKGIGRDILAKMLPLVKGHAVLTAEILLEIIKGKSSSSKGFFLVKEKLLV